MKVLFLLSACVLAAIAAALLGTAAYRRLLVARRSARHLTLDEVLSDQLLSFMLFALMAVVVSSVLSLWLLPLALAAAFVVSRNAKGYVAKQRRKELRSACDGQLDTLADIVAMGVGAGLSFDAALELYCSKFSGELSCQLSAAQVQWSSGILTRGEALNKLAEKLDSAAFARFAETSLQAISHGAPLAGLLERFAQDIRQQRKTSIEKQVEKAPVKMLIPMGLLMLPALLILVVGPAFMQFAGSGL